MFDKKGMAYLASFMSYDNALHMASKYDSDRQLGSDVINMKSTGLWFCCPYLQNGHDNYHHRRTSYPWKHYTFIIHLGV